MQKRESAVVVLLVVGIVALLALVFLIKSSASGAAVLRRVPMIPQAPQIPAGIQPPSEKILPQATTTVYCLCEVDASAAWSCTKEIPGKGSYAGDWAYSDGTKCSSHSGANYPVEAKGTLSAEQKQQMCASGYPKQHCGQSLVKEKVKICLGEIKKVCLGAYGSFTEYPITASSIKFEAS